MGKRADTARRLTAAFRTVRAALTRLWRSLGLLALVLTAGTLAFWLGGSQGGPLHGFVYTVNLITLQVSANDLPTNPVLEVAALVVAVGGLLAVAGGALNLIDYIRDPQERHVAMASTLSHHIIVCGVGRVGHRVITELLELGDSVVAVNRTPDQEWLEPLQKAGVPLIVGDARNTEVLIDAGVTRASALIACTSNDLTNLDVALDARELNPTIKIVLRMYDQKLAQKVARGFNIQTAFSVAALSAPALAAAATRTPVNYSFKLDGHLVNVVSVDVTAGSPLAGRTAGAIQADTGCAVLACGAGEDLTLHPGADHLVAAGDRVHLVGSLDAVRQLNGPAPR